VFDVNGIDPTATSRATFRPLRNLKKVILVLILLAGVYVGVSQTPALRQHAGPSSPQSESSPAGGSAALLAAISEQRSGTQVSGEGVVKRLLPDDNDGSRHQRFILTLPSGQTLLVAHNIDLASRLSSLRTGDTVEFHGVYEWNPQGGVIHWTHRDPAGRHEDGWLRHAGLTYE
jgi:hypothetical protein